MALQPHPKAGPKGAASASLDARAREELDRQDRHRTEDLLEECSKLEEDLERLKSRFELYFLGIERREPAREREEAKRRVARLKGEFTRNTGLRFRIETLHARFLSYERMWLRGAREKEEGTYRRDLLRVRRRGDVESRREPEERNSREPSAPEPAPSASAEPPDAAPASATRNGSAPLAASSPTSAPPAGRVPSAPLPSGMSEQQLRALYGAYVEAKKRCNEDVSRLSYEGLARSIAKQVPELISKYKAKTVEFKVVIKDGRTVLKAVPRI